MKYLLEGGKTVGFIWIINKCTRRITIFLIFSKTKFLESDRVLKTSSLRVIDFYNVMK